MQTQHRCPQCAAVGASLTRGGAACMACGWRDAQRVGQRLRRRADARRVLVLARRVYTVQP